MNVRNTKKDYFERSCETFASIYLLLIKQKKNSKLISKLINIGTIITSIVIIISYII